MTDVSAAGAISRFPRPAQPSVLNGALRNGNFAPTLVISGKEFSSVIAAFVQPVDWIASPSGAISKSYGAGRA